MFLGHWWTLLHKVESVHGTRAASQELRDHDVKVLFMEDDPELQRAVRELYYAIMATFDGTGCYKLFENSEGQTFALNAKIHAAVQQPTPAALPVSSGNP